MYREKYCSRDYLSTREREKEEEEGILSMSGNARLASPFHYSGDIDISKISTHHNFQ
jgi:hypothetical protein